MAIWQFDLIFVPAGLPIPASEGGAWAMPLLPESTLVDAHAVLSEHFGQPWQMCQGILVFGSEDGNRIEVVLDDAGEGELSARIDARLESSDFCEFLAVLALALGSNLFSPELGRVIDATPQALVSALMSSQAWTYALDPAEAIRRAAEGGPH